MFSKKKGASWTYDTPSIFQLGKVMLEKCCSKIIAKISNNSKTTKLFITFFSF